MALGRFSVSCKKARLGEGNKMPGCGAQTVKELRPEYFSALRAQLFFFVKRKTAVALI